MSDNQDKLPEFMSRAAVEQEDEANGRRARRSNRLMLYIAAAWFGMVLLYITNFFGWSNFFLMMPNEFGGFMAGTTLPLAGIWLVVAYIERGNQFNAEARLLRAYMGQIVNPEKGSSKTAQAMTDAIRSQVVELQEAIKIANAQADKIQTELGSRVQEFSRLVSLLTNDSAGSIIASSERVGKLLEGFEKMNKQAGDFTGRLEECVEGFTAITQNLQPQIAAVVDSVAPHIREARALVGEMDELGARSATAMGAAKTSIAKIVDESRTHASEVGEYLRLLDRRADEMAHKFAAHREGMGVEADKISARAKALEEGIALQIGELGKIKEEIADRMEAVERGIAEAVSACLAGSQTAGDRIGGLVGQFNNTAARIEGFSEAADERLAALSAGFEDKSARLQANAAAAFEGVSALDKEFADIAGRIKTQSAEALEDFDAVGAAMKKNAESLVEASSIVVAQSKVSEASLSQQQRHISASMGKIEEMKNEFRSQIDEFTRLAAVVDDNAGRAAERLKNRMDELLASSEAAMGKASELGDAMRAGAGSFKQTTGEALDSAAKMEDILETHYKKLGDLSALVGSRNNEIDRALKNQTLLVDRAAEGAASTFNEIHAAFETQSTLLNSVAQNTVGYVSDVIQALDEKAEAINLLFKYQENEFMDICSRISENTEAIGGSFKKQLASLETSSERIFGRMNLLEEDVVKRVAAVAETSEKSIEKIREVDAALSANNGKIAKLAGEAEEKVKGISETFAANVAGFNAAVREVRDETTQAAAVVYENCTRIGSVQKDFVDQAKNAASLLDGHIKNVDAAMVKMKAQAEAVGESLGSQRDSLADVANIVATQSKLGEASMAQQYKYLSDTALEVSNKMAEINAKFKSNTDGVFSAAEKIAYEFDVLGDKLIKAGEDVQKSSKTSVKSIEAASLALGNSAEDLGAAATASSAKVKAAVKDYDQYIAGFNTVTAEASSGVVEINGLITEQSEKISGISEGIRELSEYFNTLLSATSKDMAKRADDADKRVKALGESLKKLGLQLDETASSTASHFAGSGDKFRAQMKEIAANAERISGDIRTSGEVFLKQSEVLVVSADDAIEKVNSAMALLGENSREFIRRSDELVQKSFNFSELFDKQFNLLENVSTRADSKLSELLDNYETLELDTFLKGAGAVLEKLHSFAVDIERIFSREESEELWKKYYAGDTGAFVRHLNKTLDKKSQAAIKKEFEHNQDFRTVVTRYMHDYENLVNKAKTNEKSGVLISTFTGADTGKLYYILAKSLNKLN